MGEIVKPSRAPLTVTTREFFIHTMQTALAFLVSTSGLCIRTKSANPESPLEVLLSSKPYGLPFCRAGIRLESQVTTIRTRTTSPIYEWVINVVGILQSQCTVRSERLSGNRNGLVSPFALPGSSIFCTA